MNIFLSGIGGVSMSGLAHIALSNNHKVYGSDMEISDNVKKLVDKGAVVYHGHKAEHITSDIDLYVYTSAISEDNPEYIRAKELGLKMQNRAVFLGELMDLYSNPISVAGTHGKTSTTSMLSTIMTMTGNDPTILVGGNLSIINGNVRVGKSENFITEACEYTNSFLNFKSNIGIVLNIEADHLDYFKDLDEIKDSFNKFGKLIKEDGFFIINGDDENTSRIDEGVVANVIRFGKSKDNDSVITVLGYSEDGYGRFTIDYKGKSLGEFELSVPGEHNIYNSTAAIMASYVSGVDVESIREMISMYRGVGRRFEHKGYTEFGTKIIDDYAHHPTEIKATLKALKNMEYNKVWAVFQPHTYSRTESLLGEFGESFSDADVIVIPDIYASREKFTDSVSSRDLVREIIKNNEGKEVHYMTDFEEIAKFLNQADKNDIVITLGAGDVYKIAEILAK